VNVFVLICIHTARPSSGTDRKGSAEDGDRVEVFPKLSSCVGTNYFARTPENGGTRLKEARVAKAEIPGIKSRERVLNHKGKIGDHDYPDLHRRGLSIQSH